MQFHSHPLRFAFTARESIHFPPGKAANILRGAFGSIFRRIACRPECSSAPTTTHCPYRESCPYFKMFEPAATAPGPSGLADLPRPFVFRAIHLDGLNVGAGHPFHFDLNLFDIQSPALAYLVLTFAQLAREGLGPGRRKVELMKVTLRDAYGEPSLVIYENGTMRALDTFKPLTLDLTASPEPVTQITVRFLTPTELKSGHQLAPRPDFAILAARTRDRISTLREVYGAGPLDTDFKTFGERAAKVRMTRCEIQAVEAERRSTRTGQTHSIGGFIGEAEYEGEVNEFLPYLKLPVGPELDARLSGAKAKSPPKSSPNRILLSHSRFARPKILILEPSTSRSHPVRMPKRHSL